MSTSRSHGRLPLAVLVLTALTVMAGNAGAFTVRGKIVNGTTGKSVDATVYAVNPSQGMDEEQSVKSKNGEFVMENLAAQGFYLLRVDYAGISYNEPLQPDGTDKEVTVKVYETTTSWDGVKVTMPHIAAVRDGDRLVIEQMFEIDNATEPARSINGDEGFFRLYIPADVDTITQCFVVSMNVPLDRDPEATGTDNVYYLDYPIRPGVTRVGITYKVPYAGDEYDLNQDIIYDIGHVSIFAVDPHMQITSTSHSLAKQEDVHGMASWTLHGLTRGSALELKFVGGHEHGPEMAGGGGGGGGGGDVTVVAGQSESFSRYLMGTLGLVLGTLAFVTLRGSSDPLNDPKVLRGYYDLLVTRLARLDDLHATGSISNDAHKAARESLMTKLGVMALRMRAHGGKAPEQQHKPEAAPHAVKPTQAS
ncbi:MAG: hypothetical protein OEY69_06230 [Candidatus Krumholzibacteria bacterium]|nr:hypothetical protein [Candidatus Krumholzibacteria bacterium]